MLTDILSKTKLAVRKTPTFLLQHKYHVAAFVLISIWVLPYFTTGTKLNLGDFSFFAQAYEAMRISILNYHQFPWYNPWVSGGVPLYANPQMGVFSLQMVLTLLFGAVRGIKYAAAIYTFLGYGSMYYLLRRYFNVEKYLSTVLSLIWIFCTFFVAHLPEHFTFVWYMLAPIYVYMALTVKTWKSGAVFGLALAIMALSQIHNPFFHITLICGIILAVRLIRERANRKMLLIALAWTAGVFLLLAGHRFLYTIQNVHDFEHIVSDPVPKALAAVLGPILPLSMSHPLNFFSYPTPPALPYGYIENTATIGISALVTATISLLFIAYQYRTAPRTSRRQYIVPGVVLALALLCFTMAFGKFAPWAPYNILKHLPVFSGMRVSTRWFLFFDFGLLIFIALTVMRAPKASFYRFASYTMLTLGVLEMFVMNVGYPADLLVTPQNVAPKPVTSYTFGQTAYFGQSLGLPGGGMLRKDGHMPDLYREYEATTWNLGVLYANDSLVQLALDPRRVGGGHPTCAFEEGCGFVLSKNAVVTSWSPNKIVLKRTAPGYVKLNMNNSNYFVINGKRTDNIKVVEPFDDFVIKASDTTKTITIQAKPSLGIFIHKIAERL